MCSIMRPFAPDGGYMVYNGEIYGFRPIKRNSCGMGKYLLRRAFEDDYLPPAFCPTTAPAAHKKFVKVTPCISVYLLVTYYSRKRSKTYRGMSI